MGLNQYIQKIDRYLSKDDKMPLIVDVQNDEDQAELVQHYCVGVNTLIPASKYCTQDELPRFDALYNDLATQNGVFIVTGVSSFLKLKGEQELRKFIRQLLGMNVAGHVIIITYQCKQYLSLTDPRLIRRVIIIDGNEKKVPEIVLTAPAIPIPKNHEAIKGIENFAVAVESGSEDIVYIITSKNEETFPFALFNITGLQNAYDAIVLRDAATNAFPKTIGTDAQWAYALELFEQKSSWADVIDKEFGSHNLLDHVFSNYIHFSANQKWLYFIALKMFGAKNNWCLTSAAQKANDVDDFVKQAYRCLLDKSVGDKDFWDCYESRKTVLQQLGNPSVELASYCKIVFSKGIHAICYLTDNTQKEQETMFAFLDHYGMDIDRKRLLEIIAKVYPALHDYLQPFRFGNDLLDQYFQDYKYQKAINRILPEFEAEVKEQAEKREYNLILQPRASVIEGLNRDDAQLYFMDAMGVEYLGYIISVCRELDLISNIKVCMSELPSITSLNKEFLDLFAGLKHPIVSIKDIDDIKHHGKYDYDFYKNSKLPIHLIKELEVIRTVLVKIKDDLVEGKIQRAFMIADHGASRLAVLHDTENIWEMAEKGVHSGRCCRKSDLDEKPDFAADAGDFWALANYDRFRGGRKANVEVHGGATLEELCVPIIELTYFAEKPEIILMPVDRHDVSVGEVPEIEVSFRKKAALIVFSTVSLQNVGLYVNGKYYAATDLGNNHYRVDMPDLKRPNTYYADVHSGSNVIAEKLPFVIKKEGQKERELL